VWRSCSSKTPPANSSEPQVNLLVKDIQAETRNSSNSEEKPSYREAAGSVARRRSAAFFRLASPGAGY